MLGTGIQHYQECSGFPGAYEGFSHSNPKKNVHFYYRKILLEREISNSIVYFPYERKKSSQNLLVGRSNTTLANVLELYVVSNEKNF